MNYHNKCVLQQALADASFDNLLNGINTKEKEDCEKTSSLQGRKRTIRKNEKEDIM